MYDRLREPPLLLPAAAAAAVVAVALLRYVPTTDSRATTYIIYVIQKIGMIRPFVFFLVSFSLGLFCFSLLLLSSCALLVFFGFFISFKGWTGPFRRYTLVSKTDKKKVWKKRFFFLAWGFCTHQRTKQGRNNDIGC